MPKKSARYELTRAEDWNNYYSGYTLEQRYIPQHMQDILQTEVWSRTPGKIFELGCGSSLYLAKSAQKGWEISGIDFNESALELLKRYLAEKCLPTGTLILGNALEYDCRWLANQYDFLFAFGFLEHFKNPVEILQKWTAILKSGGKVISVVPNLQSVNARLLKKLDPPLWDKHIVITPEQLDVIHKRAGLQAEKAAGYYGGYDIDMLIPWNKILQQLSRLTTKLLRYAGLLIAYFLKTLFSKNHKLINPIIYGIYIKS